MTTYHHPEYLVETDWLERNLDAPELRIFDCAAYPAPNPDKKLRKKHPVAPQSARTGYEDAHIPGAGFLDVPGDLANKSSSLPMMMLPEQRFAEVMGAHGIGDDSRVVLYSSTTPIWATRVWWMLRAIGFENAAVLNGGFAKWVAESKPVSRKPCAYPPNILTTTPRFGAFVNKEEVLAATEKPGVRLIHALSSSVFKGSDDKLVFGRKGRIPGSVNLPSGNVNDADTGVYLPPDRLQKIFDTVGVDKTKQQIITYCGGGVNASNIAFALMLLGYENIAVYDGSMNEWGNDDSLPIEMG